jgi:AraC family transcriptional regulator
MAFHALAAGQTFGHLALRREAGPFLFSVTAYEGDAALPAHQHRDPYLCLALMGAYEEDGGGRRIECAAGTLLAHPAGHTHRNRFGRAGGVCLNVFPDEPWLAAHLRQFPFGGRAHWSSRRLEALGQDLLRELRREDAASALAAESLMLEILAGALRSGPHRTAGDPPWLSRVVARIEADPGAPLGLSNLAEVAGVSPAHLARSIRARFHMSLGAYVRERRLERARDLVLRSRLPLIEIAVRTGFYDQSHFNRAFKARFGVAPSALRG